MGKCPRQVGKLMHWRWHPVCSIIRERRSVLMSCKFHSIFCICRYLPIPKFLIQLRHGDHISIDGFILPLCHLGQTDVHCRPLLVIGYPCADVEIHAESIFLQRCLCVRILTRHNSHGTGHSSLGGIGAEPLIKDNGKILIFGNFLGLHYFFGCVILYRHDKLFPAKLLIIITAVKPRALALGI